MTCQFKVLSQKQHPELLSQKQHPELLSQKQHPELLSQKQHPDLFITITYHQTSLDKSDIEVLSPNLQ